MHLDVKPANIIVRKSDDKAILIDFGTAKQYDSEGTQTSTTPVGLSVGYAPIEMTKPGGVQTFSPETDIYSLGATLYYLVTGQNPPDASERMEMIMEGEKFQFSDNISSSTAEVIEQSMQARKKRIQRLCDFNAQLLSITEKGNDIDGDYPVLHGNEYKLQIINDGDNLIVNLFISVIQAINGCRIKVPNLDVDTIIEIKPGTQPGDLIRISDSGQRSIDGNRHGDLLVYIQVWIPQKLDTPQIRMIEKLGCSENFKRQTNELSQLERDGSDLIYGLHISVTQAVMGCLAEIPTTNRKGQTVQVAIKPGTQPGSVLRLQGQGNRPLFGVRKGDLLVFVYVDIPKKLNHEEKEILNKLATNENFIANPSQEDMNNFDRIKQYFQ